MSAVVQTLLSKPVPAINNIPEEVIEAVDVALVGVVVAPMLPSMGAGMAGVASKFGLVAGAWYVYKNVLLSAVKSGSFSMGGSA